MLTDDCPTPDQIAKDIERDGIANYPNALDPAACQSVREYWLDFFRAPESECEFVRGSLVLGEPNFLSYTETETGKLYRYFDFLWNEPVHAPTRELAIAIHRHRNLAQGFPPEKGLEFDPSCYGIYISVSYYVPNGGWFHTHSDGHQDTAILHHMVPLTFAGEDYDAGGLFAMDKAGNRIDLERGTRSGTLQFFDGRQEHGVAPIESSAAHPLGRLALFAIPTFFEKDATRAVQKRNRKNQSRARSSRIKNLFRAPQP